MASSWAPPLADQEAAPGVGKPPLTGAVHRTDLKPWGLSSVDEPCPMCHCSRLRSPDPRQIKTRASATGAGNISDESSSYTADAIEHGKVKASPTPELFLA